MTDPTHAVGAQLGLPQPQGEATGTAPVLTGASGMAMISEMFQRQARRLQSQEQLQAQDKKVVEYAHAQLLVMQSQLQWHASRYQERALHVNKSAQTISRMQAYLQNMEMEREKSVATALELARDVNELRHLMEASQPEKLQTLTTLSDIAMQGKDLSTLEGVGQLLASGNAAVARALTANANVAKAAAEKRVGSSSHSSGAPRTSGGAGGKTSGRPALHGDASRPSSKSSGSQQHSNGSGSNRSGSGSGSDGEKEGTHGSSNGHDHNGSSSDSADAASAASTWQHSVARPRHHPSKDGVTAKQQQQQQQQQLWPAPDPVAEREGSPPENDSSSKSVQSDSLNGEANREESPREESPHLEPTPADGAVHAAARAHAPPQVSQGVLGLLPPPGSAEGGGEVGTGAGVSAYPPGAAAAAAAGGELRQGLLDYPSYQHNPPPSIASLLAGLPPMLGGLASHGGAAANGPVVQGVLPFPGQGVVELQQGVLVAGCLQEFHGEYGEPPAKHERCATAAGAPTHGSYAGAPVAPARAGDESGEPPAKRAAVACSSSSSLLASGGRGTTTATHALAEAMVDE